MEYRSKTVIHLDCTQIQIQIHLFATDTHLQVFIFMEYGIFLCYTYNGIFKIWLLIMKIIKSCNISSFTVTVARTNLAWGSCLTICPHWVNVIYYKRVMGEGNMKCNDDEIFDVMMI